MNEENVIKKAWWLSLAGLLPFVWLSVERWTGMALLQDIFHQPPLLLLLYYSAIILSFLGGITWGMALQPRGNSSLAGWVLCYSVMPALVGWVALGVMDNTTPTHLTWIMLIGGFTTQLHIERQLHQLHILPSWFWQLRIRISAVVMLTLLLNWFTT